MKRFFLLAVLISGFCPFVFSQAIGIFDAQVSIGDDNFLGSATFANDTYTIVGSGNDLWGTADGCYYVYKEITGPFLITTEVNWQNAGPRDGDEWKKAGLMARDGVEFPDDPSNAHATGIIIRSQGSNLERRSVYAGSTEDIEVQEKRADETNVIQLMRIGNTFTMLRGLTDGTFRVIGSTDIEMLDKIQVGLVVTSHDTSTTETAFFTQVSLELLGAALTITRTIPEYKVTAGNSVTGVSLGLAVETGKTTDATVIEKVPAGLTVSNLNPSVGTANVGTDGIITWTIPGATGSDATLTYDVASSATAFGVLSFSGTATSGSNTYSTSGDWELTVIPPKANGYGAFTTSEDYFDSETVSGDAGYDPNTGTYVIVGTGNDIWGNADNFHFVFREVSGKVTLKANCQLYVGQGHTEDAKVGLMIRNESDAYSVHGMSSIRSWGRDFAPLWRDYYADVSGDNEDLNVPGGVVEGRQSGTIEITRDGLNIGFYYYDAATGQRTETLVHEVGEMDDPIFVGLAVTSRNAGYYSTGIITDVVLTVNDVQVPVMDWPLY